MNAAAVLIAAGALFVSCLLYFVVQPLRRDAAETKRRLVACERSRLELRRQLELVIGAIIGTLPEQKRFSLLSELYDRTPPVDADVLLE